MKNPMKLIGMLICATCLFVIIFGCSGGEDPVQPEPSLTGRSTNLYLGAPSADPSSSAEFSIPVMMEGASNLYAFSFRLTFDSAGLEPVDVHWADVVAENDVKYNPLDKPGLLPLAYSRLDGMGFSGDGTVCNIKFKVLDPTKTQITLVQAKEYLVAYDNLHNPITMTAGGDGR